MLSNVKINNSNLTRSDVESGVVYLRSPKQAQLVQATILFKQRAVGKPESRFPLCAQTQHPPPYPCEETLTYMHIKCYIPETLGCLGIRDNLKKTFLKSLRLPQGPSFAEVATLSAGLFPV